jgi:predicted phosphodiesterase
MDLLGWSTKRALQVSGFVEKFIEGRIYRSDLLRIPNQNPDVVDFSPPLEGSELRIMHISDLHIGLDHPTKRDHVVRLIHQLKPHLIIVSGDIVNTPSAANLRRAKEFLDLLATHCRMLLTCPGNHDRHGVVDLSDYMTGLDVLRGPYDCKFLELSDQFRVTAFLFNSTTAEVAAPDVDSRPLAESLKRSIEQMIQVRGWVDPVQLERMTAWRNHLLTTKHDAYRHSLKIAVLHHHPIPTSRSSYNEQFLILLNSGQVLDCFTDLGVDIVFHGHQHDPLIQSLRRGADDHEMVVLSAGTATKSSAQGEEENTKTVSRDSGLFLVTVGHDRLRVEEYNYANAFDLSYKFVPTRRLERERRRKRYLRYKVATKWVIQWPSMDLSVIDTHTLLASSDNVSSYEYGFGCNVPVPFEQLGFSTTRVSDGQTVSPPAIADLALNKTVDAVGDEIDMVNLTLTLDPPLCHRRGSDDVLTFSYKWPGGFEDLKADGRVQSDLSFAEPLDEFSLEVELQGRDIKEFLILPEGPTAEQGLTKRVAANRFLYRRVGVPKGLVFNYQLTHS